MNIIAFIIILVLSVLFASLIIYAISLCRVKYGLSKEERIKMVRRKYERIFSSPYAEQTYDWYMAIKREESKEIQKILEEK